MEARFLFLGTGASTGIPLIGCDCAVCRSLDPRNHRLRPSGLLSIGETSILIDIGPDFRQQALTHQIRNLDGVLLTHTHYDHIAGIDELRVFNFRKQKPFPILLSRESFAELEERYSYMFTRKKSTSVAAALDCQVLPDSEGVTDFLGLAVRYISFQQAGMKVNGFRLGPFAYVTDIEGYDERVLEFLKGVQYLVLSALREEPSPVHFSFREASEFAQKAGVTNTWLTHVSHAVDHETASKKLPSSVQIGFDGLEFVFEL